MLPGSSSEKCSPGTDWKWYLKFNPQHPSILPCLKKTSPFLKTSFRCFLLFLTSKAMVWWHSDFLPGLPTGSRNLGNTIQSIAPTEKIFSKFQPKSPNSEAVSKCLYLQKPRNRSRTRCLWRACRPSLSPSKVENQGNCRWRRKDTQQKTENWENVDAKTYRLLMPTGCSVQ